MHADEKQRDVEQFEAMLTNWRVPNGVVVPEDIRRFLDEPRSRDNVLPALVKTMDYNLLRYAVQKGVSPEAAKTAVTAIPPYARLPVDILDSLLDHTPVQLPDGTSPFARMARRMPHVASVLDDICVGLKAHDPQAREENRLNRVLILAGTTIVAGTTALLTRNYPDVGLAVYVGLSCLLESEARNASRAGRLRKLGAQT